MNYPALLALSEVVLVGTGILAAATIIFASIYDMKARPRKRPRRSRQPVQLGALPYEFLQVLGQPFAKSIKLTRTKRTRRLYKQLKAGQKTLLASKAGTPLQLLIVILLLASMTYWMYMAATLESVAFLLLGWALCSLWLLLGILSHSTMSRAKQRTLIACIPSAFFVLYVWLLVFVASAGRAPQNGFCVRFFTYGKARSLIR